MTRAARKGSGVVLLALVGGIVAWRGRDTRSSGPSEAAATEAAPGATTPEDTTTTTLPPFDGWVNPASSQEPWATTTVGYLTFRGNPTRSWYGQGPVPDSPQILWSYGGPNGNMCGKSSEGTNTQTWCGDGWTGNPNIPYAKSIPDYIFRWLGSKFLGAEYALQANNEAGETQALRPTEQSPQEVLPFLSASASDAPACAECGGMMTRNGSCYKCENCGGTSGCS